MSEINKDGIALILYIQEHQALSQQFGQDSSKFSYIRKSILSMLDRLKRVIGLRIASVLYGSSHVEITQNFTRDFGQIVQKLADFEPEQIKEKFYLDMKSLMSHVDLILQDRSFQKSIVVIFSFDMEFNQKFKSQSSADYYVFYFSNELISKVNSDHFKNLFLITESTKPSPEDLILPIIRRSLNLQRCNIEFGSLNLQCCVYGVDLKVDSKWNNMIITGFLADDCLNFQNMALSSIYLCCYSFDKSTMQSMKVFDNLLDSCNSYKTVILVRLDDGSLCHLKPVLVDNQSALIPLKIVKQIQ